MFDLINPLTLQSKNRLAWFELTVQFPTIAGRENDTRISRIAIGAIGCDSVWYDTAWYAQASVMMILCRRSWRRFQGLWHWSSKGKKEWAGRKWEGLLIKGRLSRENNDENGKGSDDTSSCFREYAQQEKRNGSIAPSLSTGRRPNTHAAPSLWTIPPLINVPCLILW